MKPTRARTLIAVAAVCGLAAWLIVRASFATLPQLPWTAAPAMLVVAVAEATTGWNTLARLAGRGDTRRFSPIAVARSAALAKATSLAGAVFAGLAAGGLGYALSYPGLPVARRDAVATGLILAAAIIMIVAALYLEHCCRAPSRSKDDDDQER